MAVLFSFYRTVNNFLMTGPKVNIFLPVSIWARTVRKTSSCASKSILLDSVMNTFYYWLNAITTNGALFFFSPKAFLTYASSVQMGAQSGIQECKHQFALERWNCPENTLQLSTHSGLRSGKKSVSIYLYQMHGIQQWCFVVVSSIPATVNFAQR